MTDSLAARQRLQASLVEKDSRVCWLHKHLFSIPAFQGQLLFTSGTRLSKVFGVIQRFFEDLELAVDGEMLGLVGDRSTRAQMSNSNP